MIQGQHWDWLAWCQYTVTGRDWFDLPLLSCCGSKYNCLSRLVPVIHYHVAGVLSNQPANTIGVGVFFHLLLFTCHIPHACILKYLFDSVTNCQQN